MEPRQYMLLQRRSLALSKVSRGWSNRPIFMPARAPAARTLALDPGESLVQLSDVIGHGLPLFGTQVRYDHGHELAGFGTDR